MSGLAAGIGPDARYRCRACGNATRFDVVATERTRRFVHADLGGRSVVEEEEVLAQQIESVTCRWCARDDAIAVEPVMSGTAVPDDAPGEGTGGAGARS